MKKLKLNSSEETVDILCLPESLFRVHPATRCSTSIEGHEEAVLAVEFSPCSNYIISGSGDGTCKLLSMQTELPMQTFNANSWVMVVSFTLDSKKIVFGDRKGFVYTNEVAQC